MVTTVGRSGHSHKSAAEASGEPSHRHIGVTRGSGESTALKHETCNDSGEPCAIFFYATQVAGMQAIQEKVKHRLEVLYRNSVLIVHCYYDCTCDTCCVHPTLFGLCLSAL